MDDGTVEEYSTRFESAHWRSCSDRQVSAVSAAGPARLASAEGARPRSRGRGTEPKHGLLSFSSPIPETHTHTERRRRRRRQDSGAVTSTTYAVATAVVTTTSQTNSSIRSSNNIRELNGKQYHNTRRDSQSFHLQQDQERSSIHTVVLTAGGTNTTIAVVALIRRVFGRRSTGWAWHFARARLHIVFGRANDENGGANLRRLGSRQFTLALH